jgi:hypothetical protein
MDWDRFWIDCTAGPLVRKVELDIEYQGYTHPSASKGAVPSWFNTLGTAPNLLPTAYFAGYIARLTLPAFRQRVHTLMRLTVPLSFTLTDWMFGNQRRRV